jgi:hypothetical protein
VVGCAKNHGGVSLRRIPKHEGISIVAATIPNGGKIYRPALPLPNLGDLHWLPPMPTGGGPGRPGLSDCLTGCQTIPAVQALPPLALGRTSGDPLS